MRSLVLEEGDGRLFERVYNLAVKLADPPKAKALQAECGGVPRFWQDAFNAMGGDDKVLTSAILQVLQVPFGAYVLTCRRPDKLEITPWLLSDAKRLQETVEKAGREDIDAQTLYSVSRSFSLTADFLTWLQRFSNSSKRG